MSTSSGGNDARGPSGAPCGCAAEQPGGRGEREGLQCPPLTRRTHPMDRSQHRSKARQVWGYFRDAQVPRWKKLTGVLALAYLFSPVDVVPDIFPIVGWLDDLGVVSAAAMFLWRDIQGWRPLADAMPKRVSEPPSVAQPRG